MYPEPVVLKLQSDLVKIQILDSAGLGGAWNSALLTGSQVMLWLLLVLGTTTLSSRILNNFASFRSVPVVQMANLCVFNDQASK